MKKQLLKKLFAFIILMFSISFINAQCTGNKVQLCKANRGACRYLCVSQPQVQKYLGQGWGFFCNCYFGIAKNNIKTPVRRQVILPADKAMFSKK